MMRTIGVLGAVFLLVGVGCGDGGDDGARVDAGRTTDAPPDQRYRGTFTVLESPEHGPQLCDGVQESYPPQCSGPDIVGWSWDDAPDAESANGTTWGAYEVTGTWDGERLTLTDPPGPPQHDDVNEHTDLTSACPEPEGGWAVVDPTTTNQQALDAAAAAAQARPDYAGLWLDQSINPAYGDGADPGDEMAMNDPTKLVLNVRVTGDVAEAERDLRAIWGGALCVSQAERSSAELQQIQQEVGDSAEISNSGVNEITGTVEVAVFVDDGLQAQLDERYGPGVVDVQALLEPTG